MSVINHQSSWFLQEAKEYYNSAYPAGEKYGPRWNKYYNFPNGINIIIFPHIKYSRKKEKILSNGKILFYSPSYHISSPNSPSVKVDWSKYSMA